MKKPIKIVAIAFLADKVIAQQMMDFELQSLHTIHLTMLVSITMLVVLLVLTFFMLSYVIIFHRNHIFHHEPFTQNNPHALALRRSRFLGLDKKAIESLPFFKFSRLKGEKEGLECAVCITKFEDNEILRLLPHCKHAFHMPCIDQWLKTHPSCPLCRNKLDAKDVHSFSYSNNWRHLQNPSDLSDDPNVELFIQRDEEGTHGSLSRFNIGSSFRISNRGMEEELSVLDSDSYNGDRKLLHKFRHRIVMSNVVSKNRWSDVNAVDMLFLRSEMLGILASNRFLDYRSERFHQDFVINENMMRMKQDVGTKSSLQELRVDRINHANELITTNSSLDLCNPDENSSRILNPIEKRSMFEITKFSMLELGSKSRGRDFLSEERTKRLWVPIIQETLRWFSGQEKQSCPILYNSSV